MSQIVKLRRSAVEGKIPSTGSIELGELAVNTADGKAYLKKDDGVESIQSLVTTDSITTGSIFISGSMTITGSFDLSGSTKFGDTADDKHEFTGSLQVNGSVTASTVEGVHTQDGVEILDTALAYAIALG